MILALHPGRNLIGAFHAGAKDAATLRFELRPAAAIRGRLLDVDGLPVPKTMLDVQGTLEGLSPGSTYGLVARGMLETGWEVNGRHLLTDAEGRFVLTPLVPGWTYSISEASDRNDFKSMGAPVTPKPGETLDLGDVRAAKE